MFDFLEDIGYGIQDIGFKIHDIAIGNTVHKGNGDDSSVPSTQEVMKKMVQKSWSENKDRRISLDPYDNWIDPDIEALSKTDDYKGKSLIMRANNGWQVVKHVFAVYVEAEEPYSPTWCDRDKEAANAVCDYLNVPRLYTKPFVADKHLQFKDYHEDKYNTTRPIMTRRMVSEAASRFGFSSYIDERNKVIVDFEKGSIYFD